MRESTLISRKWAYSFPTLKQDTTLPNSTTQDGKEAKQQKASMRLPSTTKKAMTMKTKGKGNLITAPKIKENRSLNLKTLKTLNQEKTKITTAVVMIVKAQKIVPTPKMIVKTPKKEKATQEQVSKGKKIQTKGIQVPKARHQKIPMTKKQILMTKAPAHQGTHSNSEAEDQEDSSSSDSSNSDGDSGDSGKDPSNASGASNSDSSTTGELGDDDTPESPSVSNPEPFCGSGADGMPREYDKGEDPEDGSLNNYQADKLRKEVAHDILEQEKTSPGSVPGGLLREAGIILSPQVNWKREISRDLRMFAAYWAGQDVSTYNRASRRSQKGIIFPGKVAVKPPEVSVVLDTSGSMGKKDLGFVLGQVDAMMKRIKSMSPLPTIKIINCDVATTEITEVSNVKQIELVGGGEQT